MKRYIYEELVQVPDGMILCDSRLPRIRDHVAPITKCPDCSGEVKIVNNSEIYGREYGNHPWVYLCSGCRSYVGIHSGTVVPLGTLADRETREARKSAKNIFFLWVNEENHRSRLSECYQKLAKEMNIPESKCHFGMFNSEQCNQAQSIILELLKD